MSDPPRVGWPFGLSFLVGTCCLSGFSSSAWAQAYPPDGPDIPTVTLSETQEGAAGLEPLAVPPPNGANF